MNSFDINSWPTEVLFSFFAALDPFELHNFAEVCKKWSQMSVNNELWRQFCLTRWEVLPNEKDYAKNWLIPMREGGADKERRVDWRKVYLLRDLGEKAESAIQYFTPEKKNNRVPSWMQELRKKKTKGVGSNNKSLFSEGFLSIRDLGTFTKKLDTALDEMVRQLVEGFEDSRVSVVRANLMHLANFHLELELHILSQVNVSRVKYLNFASSFLRRYREFIAPCIFKELPQRVAKVTEKFCELAIKKEVPIDVVSQHLLSCAELFLEWHKTDYLEEVDWYWMCLGNFIRAMTKYLHEVPLGEAWQKFLSEDFDPESDAPTHEIEESFNYLSMSLKPFARRAFQTFEAAFKSIEPSPRRPITILSIINAIAEGCASAIVQNLPNFMATYFFPYFQVSEDREMTISSLHYLSTLPSYLSEETEMKIAEDYAAQILPIILKLIDSPSMRIKFLVCSFITRYCEHVDDETKLEPHLQPLLEKLYVISDDNSATRHEAIFAICALLMISDNTFLKYKESALKQFKKLLATGDKMTRDSVMETLGRIGAVLSATNKASIATDVSELYAQAVEDFKNDREANESLVIKLTEFAVSSLGNNFAPFLPIIFPILMEKASADVIAFSDEMDSGDDDVPHQKDRQLDYILGRGGLNSSVEAKKSALSAMWRLLLHVDNEIMQPYLAQMRDLLWETFLSESTTPDFIMICSDAFSELITRHDLTTSERAKQNFAEVIRLRQMSETIINEVTFDIKTKEHVFRAFNKVVSHVLTLAPELLLNSNFTNELMAMIPAGVMTFGVTDSPFDEKRSFGAEVIYYFSTICKHIPNKDLFCQKPGFSVFVNFLLDTVVDPFDEDKSDPEDSEDPEERWLDLCIVAIACETFAAHFALSAKPLLDFLANFFNNDSRYIQQAVVNHYGVAMELCPSTLPTGDDFMQLITWIEQKLTPEYRTTRPLVYDNALMAYMNVIYYCEAQVPNLNEKFAFISTCFPSAVDGDWEEVAKTLKRLDQFITKRPDLLANSEIKENLRKGMEVTLKYVEKGDEEVVESRPVVTSLLAKLN